VIAVAPDDTVGSTEAEEPSAKARHRGAVDDLDDHGAALGVLRCLDQGEIDVGGGESQRRGRQRIGRAALFAWRVEYVGIEVVKPIEVRCRDLDSPWVSRSRSHACLQ
jgi:hypothetical protein